MRSVLLRHYPQLAGPLEGVVNAFQPWRAGREQVTVMAWRLRRVFWNWFLPFKFRHAKPRSCPCPASTAPSCPSRSRRSSRPSRSPASWSPTTSPRTSARPWPCSSASCRRCSTGRSRPMQAGLAQIDADPRAALGAAYTGRPPSPVPRPQRPREYEDEVDIGRLAVASPYACYLRPTSRDVPVGLHGLDGFECHAGLLPPAPWWSSPWTLRRAPCIPSASTASRVVQSRASPTGPRPAPGPVRRHHASVARPPFQLDPPRCAVGRSPS